MPSTNTGSLTPQELQGNSFAEFGQPQANSVQIEVPVFIAPIIKPRIINKISMIMTSIFYS
ncbi:MAG: hypothetical protein AABX59_01940 [Nanoarchaeota archaeon]